MIFAVLRQTSSLIQKKKWEWEEIKSKSIFEIYYLNHTIVSFNKYTEVFKQILRTNLNEIPTSSSYYFWIFSISIYNILIVWYSLWIQLSASCFILDDHTRVNNEQHDLSMSMTFAIKQAASKNNFSHFQLYHVLLTRRNSNNNSV